MKIPKNTDELLEILQGVRTEQDRSALLKEFSQMVPMIVLELLLENASSEEAKNSILTTLSLFRPDLFEEYMEKNKIVVPESLEELEEMVDEFMDNRAKVILLESVKQQNPAMFRAFFDKKRKEFGVCRS